nr:immunoglobulin light chain junction region [Macaca mulatta]
CQQNRNWPFIF